MTLESDLKHIYLHMVQFMVTQVIGLILISSSRKSRSCCQQ